MPVIGTQFEAELPDDGMYLVAMDTESFPVPIPGAFWLSVSFSTDHACWIVGEPAEIGHSADLFDGSYPCIIFNGGYPANPHASFHADVFATNLGTVYEAYRADILSGFFIPLDEGEIYADDIEPIGGIVTVGRYEVWLAGLEGSYQMTTQLWSDSGPRFGLRPLAPILGTVGVFDGWGDGDAELAIHELTPPVLMPTPRFWIAYSTTVNDAGPILAGNNPQIGFSEDCISVFGDSDPGQWSSCYECWSNCGVEGPCCTFLVRVFAVGEEPSGACCDLFADGPDCQENVPFTQCDGRWIQDATCDEADFDPPCGTAACCDLSEDCSDIQQSECAALGGYWQPGEFCNTIPFECPPPACITATNDCDVPTFESAGCNNVPCCQHVCSIDNFCCKAAWDDTCVMLAADFGCEHLLIPDECDDAREVSCNGSVIVDNTFATDRTTDPGFSCHLGGPGQNGVGSVWAKFVATSSTARLRTCDSQPPADDSIIGVYSGECGDLTEIACNDDTTGCASTGLNSDVCVSGLTIGQTYYVQLASWTEADRGQYELELICPADCPTPPNDDCANSIAIGNGSSTFSTLYSSSDGPPLPGICNEGDGVIFQNDIWFDYLAPQTGIAVADLCTDINYDSRIAVYQGCSCPLTTAATIACNDDYCELNGASRVPFPIVVGQCYKIRIGGQGGESGTGVLVVTSNEGTGSCHPGEVTFIDPPSGVVDARQSNPVNQPTPLQGIQTLTVSAPIGADDSCFWLCETSSSLFPNAIASVSDDGLGTYTITLARPISPHAVTRIAYQPVSGGFSIGQFIAHPANVNGDGYTSPLDILAIIDCLNGVNLSTNCPWGIYSTDIDHSGTFSPPDILRVLDLLNGAYLCGWPSCPEPGPSPLPAGTCIP